MPWKEKDIMGLRREFAHLAEKGKIPMRELCRRFEISPTTGYKWRNRYAREGLEGLVNRSRRPQKSPLRTPKEMEQKVLSVRRDHPAWGGRKIRRRLQNLGESRVPAASTITAILRRYGDLEPQAPTDKTSAAWQRFEAEAPNDLWQMDFKGDFAMRQGQRCYPLTVLDDHSRFSLGLYACANQRRETVQSHLVDLFRRYGMPARILLDNGSPWGSIQHRNRYLTTIEAWLIRLGLGITHSGVCHPQTLGKDERFHRTLKAEVLRRRDLLDHEHCQQAFDTWRVVYNFERPHDALSLEVPSSRYSPSGRVFPETLPTMEYGLGDPVRKVQRGGWISFQGHRLWISKALAGQPVALRPTLEEGRFDVFYGHHRVRRIDLREVSA